jgi:hypothetical protein
MSVRERIEKEQRAALYAQQAARTAVAPEDERAARLKNNSTAIKQQSLEFFLLHADMSPDEKEIVTKRLKADHLASPDVAWSLLQEVRAESTRVLAQILVGKTGEFQNKVFDWLARNASSAEERIGLDHGAKCLYASNLIESDE